MSIWILILKSNFLVKRVNASGKRENEIFMMTRKFISSSVWILNFCAALSSLSVVVLWNVAWKAHFEAFNFESTLGYAQTVHIHSFICLFSYLFATFFAAFRVCVPLTTLGVSSFYWVCSEQSDCSWSGCRKFGFNRAERIWSTEKAFGRETGKFARFWPLKSHFDRMFWHFDLDFIWLFVKVPWKAAPS